MRFTCTLPHMVSISWNGPGVEAGDVTWNNMPLDANTSTLTITNVSISHAGGYFCTALVGENNSLVNSAEAILTVNCKCTCMQRKT